MSLKLFGLLAPVALGGLYFGGALTSGYAREVDQPPAAVMAALADLDIRNVPGEPGTDPSRAGGVPPVFRTERGEGRIDFTVLSRDQVATRMTAFVEPLDGGRRTRVTAEVERGDAPDEFVSPAFRSEGLTLGLFAVALESELGALTAPPRASEATCRAVMARLEADGEAMGPIRRARATRVRLRRAGCDTDGGFANDRTFRPVSNRMGNH